MFKLISDFFKKYSFYFILLLLLFNLLAFLFQKETRFFTNTLIKLFAISFENIPINSNTIFQIFSLYSAAQSILLFYLFIENQFFIHSFYGKNVQKVYEQSVFIAILLILTGNLLDTLNYLPIGINNYFAFVETINNKTKESFFLIGFSFDLLFLANIILGFFIRSKNEQTE